MDLSVTVGNQTFVDGQIFETARKQPIISVYDYFYDDLSSWKHDHYQDKEAINVSCPICEELKARIYPTSNRLFCHKCRMSFDPVDLVIEHRTVTSLKAAEWIIKNLSGGLMS